MMKRVATTAAALAMAGLALLPVEASARMGFGGGFHGGFGGFHGGFAGFRGSGFHGMAFHRGFGPHFVNRGFRHGVFHPRFAHRRFFPAAALGFGFGLAAGSAFYDGYAPAYYDCYLQRRWTWYGPVLVRVCD